jgi:membrane-bound serine protease (ClpP class)
MALLGAEAFAPTFGILGVGGLVALAAGGILLFDTEGAGFGVPLPLVLGLALMSAAVILLGGGMALKARRKPVVSGREDLIGAHGEVLQVGEGEIWAQVRGERWKVAGRAPLTRGQQVRVIGLRGLTLDVQPQEEPNSQGGPPS